MKKILLLFVIQLFTIISVFSQTLTKPPIYDWGIKVQFLGEGNSIHFLYQNPLYSPMVAIDLIDFVLPDIDESIKMTDKILFILEMEKTEKNINITDDFFDVSLIRFGFRQKEVHVGPKDGRPGWRFREEDTIRLKNALLDAKSKMK